MAASDPTTGVPTPTGTLQGLAAFSWDGANWQPSGRAMPSVPTSTGVLRGVAPFSWDGANWQPTGKAMPSVATPSGVLDGVAVYTWSGSAWTPSGGAPDVPTPSGVLQGIAAFNWDGTAWQPAGQAAPEVPTPYGVLQGAAMFSWSGSAWAPTVAGTALDISFLNTTTLDARVTLTRNSVGTYFDATGTMQTAAANVPRFDYDPVTHASLGLLIEETRTNLLLNSAALSTQSVATTAQSYVLSFYGTGSITLSGTATGTTNGTGAATRVTTTFTPTAGTLTLTTSGSVLNAQLEAGAFPTSYIPTTPAAVTRAVETASLALGTWFNPSASSWCEEGLRQQTAANGVNIAFEVDNGGTGARYIIYFDGSNTIDLNLSTGGGLPFGSMTPGVVWKAAVRLSAGAQSGCLNAGAISSSATATLPAGLTTARFNSADTSQPYSGYIRRLRYWPRMLADTEMQQVTT